MNAYLYIPNEIPQVVSITGLSLPLDNGYAHIPDEVATYLGCAHSLVDVLDCGSNYVAYSIFDFEGDANPNAMAALEIATGHSYMMEEEDQILRGPVLVVTQ